MPKLFSHITELLFPMRAYLACGIGDGPTKLHLILDTLGCLLLSSEGMIHLFQLKYFLQLTRRSTDFHEPHVHCDVSVFWHLSEGTRGGMITKDAGSRVHLQPFQTLKQRFSDTWEGGKNELQHT